MHNEPCRKVHERIRGKCAPGEISEAFMTSLEPRTALPSILSLSSRFKKNNLHENVGENKAANGHGHFGAHAPQSYRFRARCESVSYCAALGNHYHLRESESLHCYEFRNMALGIREDFPRVH